ncbi:MAG: sigma-54 dependent transcriptional regulator [Hydrogenophaga sp.]|uniref:sigma-54-dependent transcriptional regulator n=1 Tax=Hydrogenophaga sp. TaxID=1904254 RepID=UPI00276EFA80|nr:sigma-54 dependent transcriptional regulator [Hydrogenophaga sp.]MDP2416945.1 sigma-54 dependent transcriptional regulator [Hydrogenophaga sp.]MDZ4186691.1 sigma-54 dependent transcriptional regulator [Hydrogenophaga sp.]
MHVLLIEDDPIVMIGAAQALRLANIETRQATSVEAALNQFANECPAVILSDVRLPGDDGFALLRRVRERDSELPVILMTGHGDIRMAVEAMHLGAYDFLEKPFSSERLADVTRRALEKRGLVLENRRLQALVAAQQGQGLIGQTPAMVEVRRRVAALAPTQVDVLLRGETGTGKEVVARAIHDASGRTGPFVAINCGALPESIFESEMFGHEAGAFTGATRKRVGKLEHARGGTVLLDEIESLPMSQQVKLLRVLQERVIERLGGNDPVRIDCRFIAAAKADLKALSDSGQFRHDLYYRLHVATIELPPLRERRDDIPLLLAHCLKLSADRYNTTPPTLTQEALSHWMAYEWHGNVRELRNVADRMCLGLEPAIDQTQAAPAKPDSLVTQIDAFEKRLLIQALIECEGNVSLSAERLQVPRKTLYDKIGRLHIDPTRFRL